MAKIRVKKNTGCTYYDNMHPHYERCPNPYREKDADNDIWEGRKPHNIDPVTEYAEYRTWFGNATLSKDGDVVFAEASLSYKVSMYIIGNRLRINDIRHDGVNVSFGYTCDCGTRSDNIWPANIQLEDERIDSMLRLKNINCPVWHRICARAREMWLEEIHNRDRLRQYTPEFDD